MRTKEDQQEKEYNEWKEKFGHDWETKEEKNEREKKEHNEWLLNFFRGRGS